MASSRDFNLNDPEAGNQFLGLAKGPSVTTRLPPDTRMARPLGTRVQSFSREQHVWPFAISWLNFLIAMTISVGGIGASLQRLRWGRQITS